MGKLKDNYNYMKKITKYVFPVLILAVFIAFASSVSAATVPSVYVSPTGLTKNVNESFAVNVMVSASTSTVYAVEGTISFDNLTCESIKVAETLIAQSAPSCGNPHFLIGIPKGTTTAASLVEVTIKGKAIGNAIVSVTNVDVIGEGKSLSNSSTSGNYIILNGTTSGSYTGGKNLVGSKIITGSTVTTGSKVATGVRGSKTTLDPKTATESVEANSQVASAGMSISNISIIWILIAIILLELVYIIKRERDFKKNKI